MVSNLSREKRERCLKCLVQGFAHGPFIHVVVCPVSPVLSEVRKCGWPSSPLCWVTVGGAGPVASGSKEDLFLVPWLYLA